MINLLKPVLKPDNSYTNNYGNSFFKNRSVQMNSKFSRFVLLTNKINRQHIQLVFSVLALAMLVLGIGAPESGGGPGR